MSMTIEQLVSLIVNNGTAVALLIYFIYKDNKFTDSINKSLNAINESLNVIKSILVSARSSELPESAPDSDSCADRE